MKIANFDDDYSVALNGGSVTVTTTVTGDVTGTVGALVVTGVNGVAIPGTPSAGQRLESTSGSAAAWVTMFSATTPAADGTAGSAGTATAAARSDHVHASPLGTVSVSGTAANGKVLEATGSGTATWQYPELSLILAPGTALNPFSAAGTALYAPVDGSSYATRGIVTATVATTNGTANYWTLTFNALSATGAATALGTAVTTAAIGAGTATQYAVSMGTAFAGVEYGLTTAKTGTPGPITLRAAIFYRRT